MAQRPPLAERVRIPGPAGDLEALIETPQDEAGAAARARAVAVVCHPHPLYGGTMDNKVVYTLARAFLQCAAPAVRFNYRGVGASSGAYDEGRGETEDTLAMIGYARRRWPGADLWLGGFSFGGAVAVRAAGQADPRRVVLVAPAVSRIDVTAAAPPACPWLIVQGDTDELVSRDEVLSWAHALTPTPSIAVLPATGHFFHGRINELRAAVLSFMEQTQRQ
ncbi:MAG TPA: alpha/beta fold hydrolase [Steroidobacteraceae bacterium]